MLLPTVTLLAVETLQHEMARMALDDTRAGLEFAQVVVASDRHDWLRDDERFVPVPKFPTIEAYAEHGWKHAPGWLRTPHVLQIQSDSWVLNPAAWSDEFLEFDYVAPPWWYEDEKNVGCGGFKLASRRFLEAVAALPCRSPDDEWICRRYRPALEAQGMRFAPQEVAERFGFECVLPVDGLKPFGFHGLHNLPLVLDRAALVERLRVCRVPRDSDKWASMMQAFVNLELEKLSGDIA